MLVIHDVDGHPSLKGPLVLLLVGVGVGVALAERLWVGEGLLVGARLATDSPRPRG